MSQASQASRRYAEAVVESALADGESALETLVKDLTGLAGALALSGDLANVLVNPAFSSAERSKVIEAVVDNLKVAPLTRRFIFLLSDKGRIEDIPEIAAAVKDIADGRAGRTTAYVETASELSAASIEQLKKALERRTGKKLELEISVVPELIGGVRARVGSFLLDGTIQTELARLREKLVG